MKTNEDQTNPEEKGTPDNPGTSDNAAEEFRRKGKAISKAARDQARLLGKRITMSAFVIEQL